MPDAPKTPADAPVPAVTPVNSRSQPVDLHFGAGVRVLLPGAATAVDAAQLATPQVAWLIAQEALAVQASPAPAKVPPPRARKAAAAPAKAPARTTSRTPTQAAAPAPRAAKKSVKPSSRAPSGAGRPVARPTSTRRASKGGKA